jgi:hypothetical protein
LQVVKFSNHPALVITPDALQDAVGPIPVMFPGDLRFFKNRHELGFSKRDASQAKNSFSGYAYFPALILMRGGPHPSLWARHSVEADTRQTFRASLGGNRTPQGVMAIAFQFSVLLNPP